MKTISTWSESTKRLKRLELDLPSGRLSLERVAVMGILNTTPDSFYDKGRFAGREVALRRAEEMALEGADIIDIGGEKAGPGDPVTTEEELRRVIPVIETVKKSVSLPVSVDTFKCAVAREAVAAGADIINSIGGFDDPELRRVATDTGAAIVVMHIKGRPRVANPHPEYQDVVTEVEDFLRERVQLCISEGVHAQRIIVDPGPGFGKTSQQDLELLRNLRRLTTLGFPVLLAVSRKKFIGEVLNEDVQSRLEGSLAVTTWGVLKGASIVRTHDVRETRRVVDMCLAAMHPEVVEARA
jgi:dihydropteroate synthase